nr:Fsf1 [Starmerella bombicola]
MVELPTSRYDLNTYYGRVRHLFEACSPFTLLNSNESIKAAQQQVESYARLDKPLDEQFWKAKQLVDSSVHPDTGEIVLLPFRMSCNVLSNLAITAGMLTPNLSMGGTVFWQWANQSLNVAVNYANANKSAPISSSELLKSYGIAVVSSVSIAVGLKPLVSNMRGVRPQTKLVLMRLIPFAAVVSAGLVNVGVMRSQEIIRGITVRDVETDEDLGVSRRAAVRAVGETALSRAINATPIMVVPAMALLKLQQGPLKNASRKVTNVVNLGLIASTSFLVLPFALAVFPQRRVMSGDNLEPQFKGRTVWFNRGV